MKADDTKPAEDPPGSSARRPRRLVAAAVAVPLVAIPILALALHRMNSEGTGPRGPTAADFEARPVIDDRPAPDFELPPLQGTGSVSSRSLAGSVVVLNVWASWCAPCQEEAPALEQVWTRYRTRGVRFIGVDHQDTQGGGIAFVRRFGITYPSAFDPNGTLAARYGAVGVPTTFVIDRDRRIAYRFLGKITAPALTAILDRILEAP